MPKRLELPARARGPRGQAEGPSYCVWELTLRCDLGCGHCGSRAGSARPNELDTAGCLDVVRQLAEIGVREVTLIGGEAYLRDDWDTIAAEIVRFGMVCGMTTGARNLDAARISRAIDAGMHGISVSLDGIGATHDAQRGSRGSFAAATRACEQIAATRLVLSVNSQINRLSMPELPALARHIVALGARAWQVQLTVPMGNAADRPLLLLQPFELKTLFPLLVWTRENILDPAGILFAPGNNIGYFGPFERLLRIGGAEGAHWRGCRAGQSTIALEADGTIKSCPSLNRDHYSGGNAQDTTLATALQDRSMRKLAERTPADSLWGFCQGCYYAETCLAGCTWTSHVLMGRPGNNPYCIHRALEHDRQGLQERLVPARTAPGLPFDNGEFTIEVEPAAAAPEAQISGFEREVVYAWDATRGSIHDAATLTSVLRPTAAAQARGVRFRARTAQ